MESNVLTSIPGIEYYPIVSLVLFCLLFAALVLWFFRADRVRLAELARAPFVDDQSSTEANTNARTHQIQA